MIAKLFKSVMFVLVAMAVFVTPVLAGNTTVTKKQAKDAVSAAVKVADVATLKSGAADLPLSGQSCKLYLDHDLYMAVNDGMKLAGSDCLDSATELAYCQSILKTGASYINGNGKVTQYDNIAYTFCKSVGDYVAKNGVTESDK